MSGIKPSEGIFWRLDCQCCYSIDEVDLQELLAKAWPTGHADDCTCGPCYTAATGGAA